MWRAWRKNWGNNWDVFKVAPSVLFSKSTNINAKCPSRYPWNLWIWVLCFQMTTKRRLNGFSRIACAVAQTVSVRSYSLLQFLFVLQKLQGETCCLSQTWSCRAASLAHVSQHRRAGCSALMPVYIRYRFVQFISRLVALVWISLYPQWKVF